MVLNLPAGWRVKKSQYIKQRGFSGAVRPQKSIDASIFDSEVWNVQNSPATEKFG